MKFRALLAAAFLLLLGTMELASIEPALARGGGGNIMNSPGYQRRLQESRKQLSQPYLQSRTVHRGSKRRGNIQRPGNSSFNPEFVAGASDSKYLFSP
jgi:hypothetical protein